MKLFSILTFYLRFFRPTRKPKYGNCKVRNIKETREKDMENDLKEYLLEISGIEISKNDDIIDMGILQSIDYVMLISFIKKKTGVIFSQEDLVADNFRSIENIINLIKRKKFN